MQVIDTVWTPDMDNILPKKLQTLITWIGEDNVVSSWRMIEEKNITISIRFKEIATINSQQELVQPSISSGGQAAVSYRTKPPSAVSRDIQRHQYWLGQRQGVNKGSTCGPSKEDCDINVMSEGSIQVDRDMHQQEFYDSGYHQDITLPSPPTFSTPVITNKYISSGTINSTE